ncbi:MOSC domain-containing protein [Gilvimarinus japonicus]|uniref:MOSC domain-containing protein n=1 Tax=Gilvimarinus japonicus TaxID=1796469 RepID=A0ABV7HPV1_9GAMM
MPTSTDSATVRPPASGVRRSSQARILDRLAANIKPGQLDWIGLRTVRRGEIAEVASVQALAEQGLEGDHRCRKTRGSGRQVTIISREFIEQICRHMGRESIDPALLRRNLVVSGMNLNLLRHQILQIGEAIIVPGALCHPCLRMNENLGEGGVAAMYGYGGLCAKIVRSGTIQVGDAVTRLPLDTEVF